MWKDWLATTSSSSSSIGLRCRGSELAMVLRCNRPSLPRLCLKKSCAWGGPGVPGSRKLAGWVVARALS